jgi:hypothetical protein
MPDVKILRTFVTYPCLVRQSVCNLQRCGAFIAAFTSEKWKMTKKSFIRNWQLIPNLFTIATQSGSCAQKAARCSKWLFRTATPHMHDDLPGGTALHHCNYHSEGIKWSHGDWWRAQSWGAIYFPWQLQVTLGMLQRCLSNPGMEKGFVNMS